MRFNLNCITHEEACVYLRNRAMQIAHTGTILQELKKIPEGVWAKFKSDDADFYALYVLQQFRGQGAYYKLWLQKCDELQTIISIVTTTHCKLAEYLEYKEIPYVLRNGVTLSDEYYIMDAHYGDGVTKRSGVSLMNHIDEGLYILKMWGTSLETKLAYILHPIFQSDTDLANAFSKLDDIHLTNNKVLLLAMEYRSVANEYLSYRDINSIDEIRLSPLPEVKDMLVADKIQNRKDFLTYHLGKHQRSDQLNRYFNYWLEKLFISENTYQFYARKIDEIRNLELTD